jgi:hypothetical protein
MVNSQVNLEFHCCEFEDSGVPKTKGTFDSVACHSNLEKNIFALEQGDPNGARHSTEPCGEAGGRGPMLPIRWMNFQVLLKE